jgi:hypothetical protein
MEGMFRARANTAAAIRSGRPARNAKQLAAFTNTNRYHVPGHLLFEFMKAWAVRWVWVAGWAAWAGGGGWRAGQRGLLALRRRLR